MGFFGTLIDIIKHRYTRRAVFSIDEAIELVVSARDALKDRKITDDEVDEVLEKLEALLKSLLGN